MAIIELKEVYLDYPIYGTHSRSLKSSVLRFATGGFLNRQERTVRVEALNRVNFSLKDGDRLGLIGHNGAGKSTLLKLLAGIYQPTRGTLLTSGTIHSLFDITLGLDSNLTGYENIMLRGLILGLSKNAVRKMIPEISEFAELGDYLKMPLKSYSSGMLLRLAFGIITSYPSEILLIDEIVNVGDSQFMEKAKIRLSQLIDQSGILVLSTHDHQLIREFCNKILYLEHGRLKFFGDMEEWMEKNELTK